MLRILKRSFAIIINPFTTLGLPDTASLEEAKKAYKSLAKKYHPDVNKEADPEKFREITEAYGLVKKRIESRETFAIPKEAGFTSVRPKYDGRMGSTTRDDKIREYINFTPIDIKVHDKDRLQINYRPFFDDEKATHPKTGTIWIIFLCFSISSAFSFIFLNLRKRDEELNYLLYEKLQREYHDSEIDPQKLHPALQAVTNEPEFLEYRKRTKIRRLAGEFMNMKQAPVVFDRFDLKKFEETEAPREFLKDE
jgi:hypothetical protein